MATFTVTTAGDTIDAQDGKLSLREALSLANAHADADTITFAAALEGKTLALTKGQLEITHDVTITGDPDGDRIGVTIDQRTDRPPSGEYTYDAVYARVMELRGGAHAGLSGLTIAGGYTHGGEGGGIEMTGAATSLQLSHCIVRDNFIKHGSHDGGPGPGYGGGIAAGEGTLVVANSAIIDNWASYGAAIAGSGSITVRNSTVARNDSNGAAISGYQYAVVSLENSTVTGNGQTQIDADTVKLLNSIVVGRSGPYGADIHAAHLVSNGRNILGTVDGAPTADTSGVDPAMVFATIDSQTDGGKLVLTNGTWVAPLRDSADNPALAFADTATAGTHDQRGADRPAPDGTPPDAGSFELNQKAHVSTTPTHGDDRLFGTVGADVVDALAGNDQIRGLAGNDTLRGSAGRDLVLGGPGDDTLNGGPGDDVLGGGAGRDRIDGGDGVDTASYADAFAGVTVSLAVLGRQATGGAGNDTLAHVENLIGSTYDDRLTGDATANRIDGGTGSDVIHGGAGDDVLDAGQGWTEDALSGDAGNDVLIAGEGKTTLDGGAGNDRLDGSRSVDDTASYVGAASGVRVSLDAHWQQDTLGAGRDTLVAIENLAGSSFADDLTGSAAANRLDGGAGDDSLRGGGGDDVLQGGRGSDRLYGGPGQDQASYQDADGSVQVSLEAGRAYGADGKDWLYGIENVRGGDGWDSLGGDSGGNGLAGESGNDTIYGLAGDDHLDGGSGNDDLTGGSGVDELYGQEGADRLSGGVGADYLSGGSDEDLFVYGGSGESRPGATDTIPDFEGAGAASGDRIDLAAVYAGTLTFRGEADFSGIGQVRVEVDGWETRVQVNLSGDKASEMEIVVDTDEWPGHWIAGDFIL